MQKIPGGKIQRHIIINKENDEFLRENVELNKISRSKFIRKMLNYLQYKRPDLIGEICDF
jgi:hypothetical protein